MGRGSAREHLIAAGEKLYAEEGVGRVRLRELNACAGVRNDSAVHYHFGSQQGLLEEILNVHLQDLAARIDECTGLLCVGRDGSPAAIRDAIAALAIPFADKLNDERGRRFIRIMAQVWGRTPDWRQGQYVRSSSLTMDLIRRSLRGLPENIREERMWLITRFVVDAFAARAQRYGVVDDGITVDAFVYDVVEMAAAAYLASPPVECFWPPQWPPINAGPAEPE